MMPNFYRFLYREVGKPHHWFVRRDMDDSALLADIAPERVELFVLYVDGCPAGFIELALGGKPQTVEIQYFGLMPAYQGRGLGRFFLSEAVFAAWAHKPEKVVIETVEIPPNSIDRDPICAPKCRLLVCVGRNAHGGPR